MQYYTDTAQASLASFSCCNSSGGGTAYITETSCGQAAGWPTEGTLLLKSTRSVFPAGCFLFQLTGSRHEGAANKAMYAVGVLVRSPVQEARSRFYQLGGLKKLQSLMAPSSGTALRVKSKVINLITDLIEMAATGDDTSLETWDDQVMSQFAAAALDMLGQAEELDGKEKALVAMRVLLTRRGGAGRAALEEENGEPVLREALTELDLLVEQLGGWSESALNDAAEQQGGEASSEDRDKRMYAVYVAHLCADVLHHLSIQHAEL